MGHFSPHSPALILPERMLWQVWTLHLRPVANVSWRRMLDATQVKFVIYDHRIKYFPLLTFVSHATVWANERANLWESERLLLRIRWLCVDRARGEHCKMSGWGSDRRKPFRSNVLFPTFSSILYAQKCMRRQCNFIPKNCKSVFNKVLNSSYVL